MSSDNQNQQDWEQEPDRQSGESFQQEPQSHAQFEPQPQQAATQPEAHSSYDAQPSCQPQQVTDQLAFGAQPMTDQPAASIPPQQAPTQFPQQPQQFQQTAQQPIPPYQAYQSTSASGFGAQSQPQVPPAAAAGAQAAAAVAAAPVQKKSHAWIVAIVIVACIFVLIVIGIASCSSAVSSIGSSFTASAGYTAVEELTEPTVAVIDITGTIQYDDSACSPEGFKYLLDEAEENDNIKAVVLRVDSGGGTATAGEEMAVYLQQFSKPVVVSSASINASAAYEISSQADYIFVAKTTEIGAIGTALQITDISELLDMLGIRIENITSSDSKDSSYGTRALSDEERAYYQSMVDQINETFIENVAEGRGMTVEEVRSLATGLAFTGMDAVKNGIADEIGTREDAIEKAAELAGLEGDDYAVYNLGFSSYDFTDLASLFSRSDAKISADDIDEFIEMYARRDRIAN